MIVVDDEEADVENDVYGVLSASVMGNPKEQTALRRLCRSIDIPARFGRKMCVLQQGASVVSLALKTGVQFDGLWQTVTPLEFCVISCLE
jgi:hypothetical protein